jgi:signal transduction histidine kinase
MGIGVSVFLLAVGAILAFAVDVTTEGIDLNMVGIILMIVGALGLIISLIMLSSINTRRERDSVVREERY